MNKRKLLLSALGLISAAVATKSQAATYYYNTGSVHLAASWTVNANGTGGSPSNFNGNNIWIIGSTKTVTFNNGNTSPDWVLGTGGTAELIVLGTLRNEDTNDDITVANFTVGGGGTYIHNNGDNNIPGSSARRFHSGNNNSAGGGTAGTSNGTVVIEDIGSGVTIPNIDWGNLTFTMASGDNAGRAIHTVKGNLTVNSGTVFIGVQGTNTATTIDSNVVINGGTLDLRENQMGGGNPSVAFNVGGNLHILGSGSLERDETSGSNTVNFTGTNKTFTIGNNANISYGDINWSLGANASVTLRGVFAPTETFTLNSAANTSFTIADTSSFTNGGTADFNGRSVTVKSSALGTGSIGESANTISNATNVTIERYLPSRRSWRLLAAPLVAASAPTILNAWQEGTAGSNPNSGFGTWISAPGYTGSNGFDGTSPSTSIQYWASTGAWATPANTNTIKVTDSGAAWFLFVRGDKSLTTGTVSGVTTLRMNGSLRQGNQTTGKAAATLSLIANPYASTIDYELLYQNNNTTNAAAKRNLYLWDANQGTIGAYRTVTRSQFSATYTSVPAAPNGTSARYILSGQAFFVGANTTMAFTEAMKVTNTAMPVFKTTDGATTGGEALNVNLNLLDNGVATIADGLRIEFDAANTNTPSAEEDVVKLSNPRENLSISNNNADYVIERHAPITGAETIQLRFWNASVRDYQLNFEAANFSTTAGVYLVDAYTNTVTPISTTANTDYNFSVTNDAASYDPNRFQIVFGNAPTSAGTVAANASEINVFPNPMVGNNINITFTNVKNGAYDLQIVNMAGAVVKTMPIQHEGSKTYTVNLATQLPAGIYNVSVKDNSGKTVHTQQVVKQ